MLGNFAVSNTVTFGDGVISIPSNGYAVNSDKINPAEDGSFSVNIALTPKTVTNTTNMYPIAQASNAGCTQAGDLFVLRQIGGTDLIVYVMYKEGSAASVRINDVFAVDQPIVIDLTVSGSSMKVFVNGALCGEASFTFEEHEVTKKLGINCLTGIDGVGTIGKGTYDIYVINIYERTLKPEEVLANFENINSRYNLSL